jgi:hypothetical protein
MFDDEIEKEYFSESSFWLVPIINYLFLFFTDLKIDHCINLIKKILNGLLHK